MNELDKQVHYTILGIEPIDIMRENFTDEELRGFLKGNIIKYLFRKKEQDVEDAEKIAIYARWYADTYHLKGKDNA